jgi:hypothetical protein
MKEKRMVSRIRFGRRYAIRIRVYLSNQGMTGSMKKKQYCLLVDTPLPTAFLVRKIKALKLEFPRA